MRPPYALKRNIASLLGAKREKAAAHLKLMKYTPVLGGILLIVAALSFSNALPWPQLLPANAHQQRSRQLTKASGSTKKGEMDETEASKTTQARALRTPLKCPSWLADYAEFHKQMRGSPDAKYLVFDVDSGTSGLGDRLRGMMFATRLAVSLNRVVLFTWHNSPHEPDRFLPPSGYIDWRLQGIEGYQQPLQKSKSKHKMGSEAVQVKKGLSEPPDCSSSHDSPCFRITNYRPEQRHTSEWVQNGGLSEFKQQAFVSVITNHHADTFCKGCPSLAIQRANSRNSTGEDVKDIPDDMNNPAACLFHYLFKTSGEVVAAADQQLLQMYGPEALEPGFQFVAMHLRLGGMKQEKVLKIDKGSGNGDLADLMTGMECANELGAQHGINTSETPVLMITDNIRLRRFARAGNLKRAVTSDITPTHLARMREQAADASAAISSYVDLELLARSTCLVASASGFSNTAWLLGGGIRCVGDLKNRAYIHWRAVTPCKPSWDPYE